MYCSTWDDLIIVVFMESLVITIHKNIELSSIFTLIFLIISTQLLLSINISY